MADYVFQTIAKRGLKAGVGGMDTELARDWFRDQASRVSNVNTTGMIKTGSTLQNRITQADIGRMFHFFYDPKWKVQLPYYDRFPLIFVAEKYPDGFLGINLHYLPPIMRARLMDALYSIEEDDSIRKAKKIGMSYGILKGISRFKYFQPCVKRYLNGHIRSRFLWIPNDKWDMAIMLPTERFMKKGKRSVWGESVKRI